MGRVFIDEDLLSWEAYASGGKYGLPLEPKIVFNCLSDPGIRARYVNFGEDNAVAEHAVRDLPENRLRELLRSARPLD